MLAILSDLIPTFSGGLLGLIPSVFKVFSDSLQQKRDNAHEIIMLKLSYQHADAQNNLRLAEREIITQEQTTIATLQHDVALGKENGIKGFLRATVRPVCTYIIVFPLAYTMWRAVLLSRSIDDLIVFMPPELVQFTITSIITFWFSAQAMRRDKC